MIPTWKELRLDAAWDINGEAASAAHRREVQVGVRSSRGRKPGGAETEVLNDGLTELGLNLSRV